MVILWQDYCGNGNFEKILLQNGWEKVSNWECLFVHREKGLFLSVYVDDIKLAGKKQNLDPMWLDHVYRDVLKDNAKEAKILWTITEPCLNHEFPGVELKNYQYFFVVLRYGGSCQEMCGTIL